MLPNEQDIRYWRDSIVCTYPHMPDIASTSRLRGAVEGAMMENLNAMVAAPRWAA